MSTAVDADTKTALATAANEARGLAMDSIAAAHSGHMGLPLGCAEIGATLYGSQVRNVFILSNISGKKNLKSYLHCIRLLTHFCNFSNPYSKFCYYR